MKDVCLGFYSYNDSIEILQEFINIDYANLYTSSFKNSQELAAEYNLWPETRFCLIEKETKKVISNDIIFFGNELLKKSLINLIQNYNEKYNNSNVNFWLNERTILELKKILNICEKNKETYEKGKQL